MSKNISLLFCLFSCITISFPQLIKAQTAYEIIQKTDEKMRGDSDYSEMKMTIERPNWKREVVMKAWALGMDYSLILITSPARDKGSAFLKREKEIWNWQPSIDRVIKLPPSMMMQSWMGSDFTNDDLVKESSILNDYTHVLMEDSTISDKTVYKVRLLPKEDAAVVWGRIDAYIDKETFNQVMLRYYDEDDYLINIMLLSEEREVSGRYLPTKMEMIPAENPDQKTIIEYTYREIDKPIKPSFFSLQNMKRVK